MKTSFSILLILSQILILNIDKLDELSIYANDNMIKSNNLNEIYMVLKKLPKSRGNRKKADRLNRKALSFHKKKNYSEAIKIWHKMALTDPGYWKSYFNLACTASLTGEYTETFNFLELAWELGKSKQLLRSIKKDGDLKAFRRKHRYKLMVNIMSSELKSNLSRNTNSNSNNSLIRQRFCKSRSMPYETGYELLFAKGGKIKGSINFSGNCDYYKLVGGTWEFDGNMIIIDLNIVNEKVCTSPGDPIGTKYPLKKRFKFKSLDELRKKFPDQC